ncbi:MAG: protein kinase [Chloroflexota bacterium]
MKDTSLIGQKLANFQIKRLIGRGGMAEVYYGWDVKLQRPVAIKIIDRHHRANPAYAARFVKEARVLAKWRHENIVQIYYADDTGGLHYYVMEHIDGRDLSTLMSDHFERGDVMPIAEVLRIGRAVAKAVDYAHHQKVIHRDIKPSNIMIAKDGRVVLGDFGLALDMQERTLGEAFGTPQYISPEQARRSNDAVPQSDIYSFGVILYEMLTGMVPFNDPSPATLALQHITQLPPSPRSINPDLPPDVDSVLLKALEKNPRDRYRSAESLMEALARALESKATQKKGKPALPPIPVGAPTIHRNDIRVKQVGKDKAPKVAPARKRPQVEPKATPKIERSKKETNPELRWFLSSLVFIGVIAVAAWLLVSNLMHDSDASPTSAPTVTATPAVFDTSLETDIPTGSLPSATLFPTSTLTPPPAATATNAVMPTSTTAVFASPTISISPTIQYADGLEFTLYYNETSFYLYNNSTESRSLSGFEFERVNTDGTFANHFGGWDWEIKPVRNSEPDRCVRIEIYAARNYLGPAVCKNFYLSTLQPAETADTIFWTLKENSRQFRVLWMDEEIARCEVDEETCVIFVP